MSETGSESTSGGSRLQWWQDRAETKPWYRGERPVVASPTTEVPVVVSPMDIGEELEAESRRRMHAEATGARVVVPYNRAKYTAKARKRFFYAASPVLLSVLIQLQAAIVLHSLLPVLTALLGAIMIALMWMTVVKAKAGISGPPLVMTEQGLEIRSAGMIYWHEIAEVKQYKFAGNPVVTIVPRDHQALAERLKGTSLKAFEFRSRPPRRHELATGTRLYGGSFWRWSYSG